MLVVLPKRFRRSVSAFLVAASLALLPHTPCAAQSVLVPQSSFTGFFIGRDIGTSARLAIESSSALARSTQNLSDEIDAARSRFWAGYPNSGPAERDFARLLFAKDFYYLTLFLPQGPYTEIIKNIAQSNKIDGGIPDGPRSFFYAYVEKVREALGATNHIPAPKKEPDLVFAIPTQVFAAHDNPEVQEAYLKYLVSRDRYEFEKAGRGADLNDILAKLRGPVQIAEPTAKRAGYGDIYGTELAYTQVPEDFVPTIDLSKKMKDDDKFLTYSMKKDNPGSLIKIRVSTFFYPGLIFTREMSDAAYSGDPSRANSRKIIFEDADRIRKEEGALLTCTYVSNSSGTEIVRYFWYRNRVAAAEAGTLRSRLGSHPLLVVRDARDTCPPTSAEADGRAPAARTASVTPNTTAVDAQAAAAAAAQKELQDQAQKARDEQTRKAQEAADARKKAEDEKLEAQRQQKAAFQTFQDEFLTRAKRPNSAFGKAITGVQLGMTMTDADAAIRKNMNVKFAAATTASPPPSTGLNAGRMYVNPDFSKVTALYTHPAASDRVVAVVAWIQLPDQRMTVADVAGELIKAYGEPAGKQGAGNMGWYEEKTPCEWPRLEWPVNTARPPMDQNGTPIWSSYGGAPMKESEYLVESRRAIRVFASPELPAAMANEMRAVPMTRIVCGPALFAQTVVQGAFVLVLYDKLWFDALYYESERTARDAMRQSTGGILNAK